MYVLQFLAGKFDAGITTEYRLLCSGELFNKNVMTFDYRKSEPSRWLLAKPFNLRIVSQPFYAHPQELRLVFSCSAYVTEGTERCSITFPPDDDIAKDLAALLTVFLRRLVTPAFRPAASPPRKRQTGRKAGTQSLGPAVFSR